MYSLIINYYHTNTTIRFMDTLMTLSVDTSTGKYKYHICRYTNVLEASQLVIYVTRNDNSIKTRLKPDVITAVINYHNTLPVHLC